jgi:hypothetical protein
VNEDTRDGDDYGRPLSLDDINKQRPTPRPEARAGVEQDLALGQLIYGLRAQAGLSQ